MKVQAYITLSDQTSEEQLAAAGISSGKLLEVYTEAFTNLLQGIAHPDVKVELHVVVTDNTKEDANDAN